MINYLKYQIINRTGSSLSKYVSEAVEDAYKRLISPSIERDIRNSLTSEAEDHAIKVFSENLKNLLLQPPIQDRVILGIDPAYRTGCKIAVIDETGKVLETGVIYPTPPQEDIEGSKEILKKIIKTQC